MATVKLTDGELQKVKQEVLKEQEAYLCEELGDPGRYFPFLRSKGVLAQQDCESIRNQPTTDLRVGVFVKALVTLRGNSGVSAFDVFVEALKKQKVQAHIARSLLKAFARKKGEKEREKVNTVEGQANGDIHARQSPKVIQAPVQATSDSSPLSPSEKAPNTRDNHAEPKFDIHPQHGPLPPLPERKIRPPSPTPPSEDIHPQFGLLPPQPPTSSSASGAQLATSDTHPDHCEIGLRMGEGEYHSPTGHSMPFNTSSSPAPWSPTAVSNYKAKLRQHLGSQSESSLPSEPSAEGMSTGQSLEHQVMTLQQQNLALKDKVTRMAAMMSKKDENLRSTRAENEELKRRLEEVKDYEVLAKQLERVKEELHVTRFYRKHHYDAVCQSGSDLDDYAQLQEEFGRLQKKLAEQSSRLESLERENLELTSQIDDYSHSSQLLQQQLQSLQLSLPSNVQSRPQHLPINNQSALQPGTHPSYHLSPYGSQELLSAGDLPGLSSARSTHAGDNFLKHSVHSPGDRSSHRHSAGSGDGVALTGTPLSSSSTSISSHGSGILKFSNVSQATLV